MPGDQQKAPGEPLGYDESPAGAGRHGTKEDPGLAARNAPGKRSGQGSDSVLDQLHKDQQRNVNGRDDDARPPAPARDATA